jgi:hypothetical protein
MPDILSAVAEEVRKAMRVMRFLGWSLAYAAFAVGATYLDNTIGPWWFYPVFPAMILVVLWQGLGWPIPRLRSRQQTGRLHHASAPERQD